MKHLILLLSACFLVAGCGGKGKNEPHPTGGDDSSDTQTENVRLSYETQCETVPGRTDNWEQYYKDRYSKEGGKGEATQYRELFNAVVNDDVDAVEEVVEKNNINLKSVTDSYGRNPLHWVVFYFGWLSSEHPDLVEYFIEQGVDVNAQDHCGSTPLHYVAEYKSDYTFANESLDYWNSDESAGLKTTGVVAGTVFTTVLFDAQESIAEQFIDAEGDVTIQNRNGHSPLDVAGRSRGADITGTQDDVYDEFYAAYSNDYLDGDDEDEDEDEDEEDK